ncbi:pseudouridine synthase [Kaarinaea lacus]
MFVIFNKPYNVLSQFTDSEGRETLATYIKQKGIYAAGRLDRDSEGLLILTSYGKLQHYISQPRYKMAKTYWAQVEREITPEAVDYLRSGVKLKDGTTAPAKVQVIDEPDIWPRNPPIRERKNVPTSWIEISITEGRNRQVRRMTAEAGFPTLRLVRVAIGPWQLGDLQPGQYREIPRNELLQTLSEQTDVYNPEKMLLSN